AEVSPDGTSVLVTKGILNLTRRNGMITPEPMVIHQPTPVQFDLEATAWRFQRSHRIRLSINGSDFPNVWPTPLRGTGSVHHGTAIEAELHLPVWQTPQPSQAGYRPSESLPAATGSGSEPPPWRVVHDVLEDRLHFVMATGNEFCVSNRNPADAYAKA